MEIQALKLIVTEADANLLLGELAPQDLEVRNPHIRFTPDGVCMTGETSMMLFKVSFETLWDIGLLEGCVVARLNALKVAGIPAGKLRGVLLKMVRDALSGKPGIVVENEMVRFDVNEVLRSHQIPLRVALTGVRCVAGSLIIEA